jgi:hypothetical protein
MDVVTRSAGYGPDVRLRVGVRHIGGRLRRKTFKRSVTTKTGRIAHGHRFWSIAVTAPAFGASRYMPLEESLGSAATVRLRLRFPRFPRLLSRCQKRYQEPASD